VPRCPAGVAAGLTRLLACGWPAGALNDYQKELQFRKLNAQKDSINIKVRARGGGRAGMRWDGAAKET